MNRGTTLAIILAFALLPALASAQTPGDPIPGRYLVTFKPGVAPPAAAQELSRGHGFTVRHVYRYALRGMAIEIPGAQPERVLNALRRDPRVRTVGPDRYIGLFAQTLPKGINRINAEPALRANSGSAIEVAVIDTGLDFNHNDLAANTNASLSVNCINGGGSCSSGGLDDNGHGTFVGGIVAAVDNTIDVIGVGPDISLLAVKVLDSAGSGSFTDVTAGVDYLTGLAQDSQLIEVANMSLGATCSVCTDDSTDPTISAFHDAVRALVNAGTTVVVAAGNDGRDATTSVPASFDEVVTVSALADTDGQPGGTGGSVIIPGLGKLNDDTFAKFSNFGADIDVIAPGVAETSLELGGGTSSGSGTSFSSPHAAGVAALFIRDQLDKSEPLPSPGTVRLALIQTGECHEGGGTIFHGAAGCSEVWPDDPDGIPEPLVRADNIANFGGGGTTTVHDVAVTSISAPSPVNVNTTHQVDVGVANQGTESETFDVSLTDSLSASISGSPTSVTLAAGSSTTVSFDWTPTETGDHLLAATASTVSGETDTADNGKSTTVTVNEPSTGGAPTVTAIDPDSMTAGTSVDVTISGSGFVEGASVNFENGSGPAAEASNVGFVSDTQITATVTAKSGGPPRSRTWDVVVTNPDGQSGRLAGGFTVNP